MPITIKTSTTTVEPSSLKFGELAYSNVTDNKLFVGDKNEIPQEIAFKNDVSASATLFLSNPITFAIPQGPLLNAINLPFQYNNLGSTVANYTNFFIVPTNANNYATTLVTGGVYSISIFMPVGGSQNNDIFVQPIRNGAIMMPIFLSAKGQNLYKSYTWVFGNGDTLQFKIYASDTGSFVQAPIFSSDLYPYVIVQRIGNL